ncbi:MAG: phosphatase PAP2 family protein [Chloroflexi bacterium]|nr:phosphatase PAP2 family protein [Chloroflexota bacterium]
MERIRDGRRADPRSTLRRAALWIALFLGLTILVQARLLAPLDEAGLRLVADRRPAALAEGMNWIFRLGFVQVNAVMAIVWAALVLIRRRSLLLAVAPLILFVAIGAQAGLRLAVDQPAPGSAYAFHRRYAAQPVGDALDRADAAARDTFAAAAAALVVPATAPATTGAAPTTSASAGQPGRERGSYPSGHATRVLFLVLLAGSALRRPLLGWAWLGRRLPLVGLAGLAALVGYSALYYGYHWPSDVVGGYLLAVPLWLLATQLQTGRFRLL